MTTVYVARHLGEDTDILSSGAVVGAIVGGDTALDTRDGDTSYVRVTRNWAPDAANGGQIPFRWEKLSGPTPNPASVTAILIDTEYRTDELDTTGESAFSIGSYGETVGGSVGSWFSDSETEWTYEEGRSIGLQFAENVISGAPWNLISLVAPLFTQNLTRITYLRLTIETGQPRLRQRLRDDLRARNHASRQKGLRAKGFY